MPHTEQDHTEMEFVEIPQTSIRVSRVALGTWAMGGWMWGGSDESGRHRDHSRRARPRNQPDRHGAGVRFWAVGGDRRQGACYWRPAQERSSPPRSGSIGSMASLSAMPAGRGSSMKPKHSLRRLQTDVIDLYQVHWPDPHYADRGSRRGHGRASSRRKNSRHRRQQFQPGADEGISQGRRRCTRSAALQSVRARHRDRTCFPIAASKTSRCWPMARCAAACCPAACRIEPLYRRRPAQERSEISATSLRAYLAAVERLDQFAQERFGRRVIHLAVRWVLDRGEGNIALWGARRADSSRRSPTSSAGISTSAAMAEIDRILRIPSRIRSARIHGASRSARRVSPPRRCPDSGMHQ